MASQTVTITTNSLTPEQIEKRREGVGGSDAASLFAEETRYGCPTRLWFQKRNVPPDFPRTQREEDILKRGHIWESVVALYFQEATGLKVRRCGSRVSKECSYLAVNMDRQIIGVTTEQLKALWPDNPEIQAMEGECGPGYLEAKTTNEYEFKRMMTEGIIPDYIFQVNHGLMVTDYRWGVFAVLEPTWGQFATFPFVFKVNLAEEQLRRSAAFWKQVQDGSCPAPPAPDRRCKNCQWRRSCPRAQQLMADADKEFTAEGYTVDNSDTLIELLNDLRDAKETAEEKAATVETIKERIKEEMGDREKIEVTSAGARISWAQQKPSMMWDGTALTATAEQFRKKGETEIADSILSCKKPKKGARPFNVYTI